MRSKSYSNIQENINSKSSSEVKAEKHLCIEYWNRLFDIYGFEIFVKDNKHKTKPLSVIKTLKHVKSSDVSMLFIEFIWSKYDDCFKSNAKKS